MTQVSQLIELLREEQRALQSRDWEKVSQLAVRKSDMLDGLAPPISKTEGQLVERLASENQRLLEVYRQAVESVTSRLSNIGNRSRSIGYDEGGDRLKISAQDQLRRV